MIALTCDLHHQSLGTGNQAHCPMSEIQVAQRFVKLIEEANVKATFFITGRAFAEQPGELRPIIESPLIEIGGHTYDAFEPAIFHRIWKKIGGSYNGPAFYQKRDARRTIDIIEQHTGARIRLWRNHMYMHGPHTEKVLASLGIRLISDGVSRLARGPSLHSSGIYNFPINIIPDHEHLYHAERTPQWVAAWQKRYHWSDEYGPDSYYVEEWTDLVLAGLKEREAAGAISNMIIHPITMYLSDRFHSFKRILAYLKTRQTMHLGETIPKHKAEHSQEVQQ